MNNNVIKKTSVVFIIIFMLIFTPIIAYADEVNIENEGNIAEEVLTDELGAEEINETEENENKNQEEQVVTTNPTTQGNRATDEPTTTTIEPEEHKVEVITTKVDENGNPLSGAVLQILDSEGNIVDEWTSDDKPHTSMLYEGSYTLHEKTAPEGYKVADDKTFTVKVEVADLDSGVDWSETPCPHYGGTPLYYVEIEGEKYEVYCINQDWETPDENSTYDGGVLNPEDIRDYMQQTVYIDAEEHKDKIDVSDQSLTSEELYDKILDIIYHRQLAADLFPDLTEAEIRYITESALKNYTNAGLTRIQGGISNISNLPEGVVDYWYNAAKGYYQYLYTHFRSFVYVPDAPLGTDIFKIVVGEGDAFGTLARHWNEARSIYGIPGHNAKNNQSVRDKIARYYELYLYLIGNNDHHPSDMHLYIYASNDIPADLSGNDYDGAYQNLLGIHWYTPENHTMHLTYKNEPKKEGNKKKEKKKHNNPQTGDDITVYVILLSASLSCLGGCLYINRKELA